MLLSLGCQLLVLRMKAYRKLSEWKDQTSRPAKGDGGHSNNSHVLQKARKGDPLLPDSQNDANRSQDVSSFYAPSSTETRRNQPGESHGVHANISESLQRASADIAVFSQNRHHNEFLPRTDLQSLLTISEAMPSLLLKELDRQTEHKYELREQNSQLMKQSDRLKEENALFESRIIGLEQDLKDQKAMLERQLEDQCSKFDQEWGKREKKYEEETRHLKETHSTELESSRLQQQGIQSQLIDNHKREKSKLEQAIVAPSDRFQPLPDSMLQERLSQLRRSVGRLARSLSRSERGFDAETLGRAFTRPESIEFINRSDKRHWKFAVESEIWAILWQGFFAIPFGFGALGRHGERLAQDWADLFETGSKGLPSRGAKTCSLLDSGQVSAHMDRKPCHPMPDSITEKWRSTMFETLRLGFSEDAGAHAANPQLKQGYDENWTNVCEKLSGVIEQISPVNRSTEIGEIAVEAQSFAMDVGSSRARLELLVPPRTRVAQTSYAFEDCVERGTNDSLREGVVELVVAPGLRKQGDHRGARMDCHVDLLPALVYLRG